PVWRVARRGAFRERRRRARERCQLRAQHRQRRAVEAGTDVADVPQAGRAAPSDGLAEHERAQDGPGALRPGPPADEVLAALLQLHLAPGLRPTARLVPRIGVLDDEALPVLAPGPLVQGAPVAGAVDALAQPLVRSGVQQRLEARAAQRERQRTQVFGA